MDEVKKLNYNLSDLVEQMRLNGYTNIPDIHYAILETNGQLSVLPYDLSLIHISYDRSYSLLHTVFSSVLSCFAENHLKTA